MILDVFPSYKDKDMVDLLYQFERATGSSLNILVEKYLEKLLYEKGYLTQNINQNNVGCSSNELKEPKFKTKYYSKNRSIIVRGNLNFGSHMNSQINELIDKLEQFSTQELEKISSNNWDKSNGNYSRFLKHKLENPGMSLEDFLSFSRFSIAFRGKQKGYQIRTVADNFSVCSVKDTEEFESIKNYLFRLSNEELDDLKKELKNSKNRRECILKKMKGG